jgi:hypothetical protein
MPTAEQRRGAGGGQGAAIEPVHGGNTLHALVAAAALLPTRNSPRLAERAHAVRDEELLRTTTLGNYPITQKFGSNRTIIHDIGRCGAPHPLGQHSRFRAQVPCACSVRRFRNLTPRRSRAGSTTGACRAMTRPLPSYRWGGGAAAPSSATRGPSVSAGGGMPLSSTCSTNSGKMSASPVSKPRRCPPHPPAAAPPSTCGCSVARAWPFLTCCGTLVGAGCGSRKSVGRVTTKRGEDQESLLGPGRFRPCGWSGEVGEPLGGRGPVWPEMCELLESCGGCSRVVGAAGELWGLLESCGGDGRESAL